MAVKISDKQINNSKLLIFRPNHLMLTTTHALSHAHTMVDRHAQRIIHRQGLTRVHTSRFEIISCCISSYLGAGRSSEVERSLMMRWVVGSILHGVDPLSYFSFQPVLHDWCDKGRGMCYPVCGMVHIKEPLLLIGKSSLCGGSGFPFSLSEWSLTICLTPYNRR